MNTSIVYGSIRATLFIRTVIFVDSVSIVSRSG